MTKPTEFDLNNLENAGRCRDPIDVVRDPSLTTDKKRALLASWASDARAVPDHPALRRLDDGRLVSIDDVLDALKAIDDPERSGPHADAKDGASILRGHWSRLRRLWRKGRDDDDDNPPTAPATLQLNRPNVGGALAAVA